LPRACEAARVFKQIAAHTHSETVLCCDAHTAIFFLRLTLVLAEAKIRDLMK
jgi:hypothetical protein